MRRAARAAVAAAALGLAACGGGDGSAGPPPTPHPSGHAGPASSRDPAVAGPELERLGHRLEWLVISREAAGAPPSVVPVPQAPPRTCVVQVATHDGRPVPSDSPPAEVHVQVADPATARALGRAC